jgi:non-ribosomal peptide synthetase component E (peptide arylation enzyme)
MYAGAPCPIDILRRLHERLGCALSVFYGWTEGLAHTYSLPSDPLEVTSVTIGRVGEGWEARVVGDDGQDVAVGETGEFWGRGPNLSPGYYHQPDFMPARYGPDGWFMSGDLVTRNEDGTYTFVARKDDVINRGGLKIDPRELEEILYRHPGIAQAVVVGYPDPRLGERTCAFVVPAANQQVDLEEVKAYLGAEGLAKYKWPERLEILARLPMTPTGKIMRYELRAQLADQGARGAPAPARSPEPVGSGAGAASAAGPTSGSAGGRGSARGSKGS